MSRFKQEQILSLKSFFVCSACCADCKNSIDENGEPYGPDFCIQNYFPRKQKIECLGKYCDTPCGLQKDHGDITKQLFVLISYLSEELNKYIKE